MANTGFIRFLDEISKRDVIFAGGKGANLGEMYKCHLPVPEAFVLTTNAYELFVKSNDLEAAIERILSGIDVDDTAGLERRARRIRRIIESSVLPEEITGEVSRAYSELCRRIGKRRVALAVRSSATAEDLRDASFAGQQSSYLNVNGEKEILESIKKCWASVYTARATFYRAKKGFGSHLLPTAVVLQQQINSEKAGVGFSIHPLTGSKEVIVIEGGIGQGEDVVSGRTTPDTFVLEKETGKLRESRISVKAKMKIPKAVGSGLVDVDISRKLRNLPSLNESELRELWRLAKRLEEHYGYPQDFEWAIEGGDVFLVQTRPVTVISKQETVKQVPNIVPHLKGLGASPGIGIGVVRLVKSARDLNKVNKGDILVTKMTTPDFVPAMMKTAGIVTDEGGMTSHAAIVSRELGVPCIVGTGKATEMLSEGSVLTIDGSRGLIFKGKISEIVVDGGREEELREAGDLVTETKVYMNLGVPEKIGDYLRVPFDGIGLMRVEFILASYVGEHPLHLLETGRSDLFIGKLSEGIATVARAAAPRPVVVRFSDFKTNEYRELKGGEKYEDVEANPMLGWRGISRYVSKEYEEAFRMELKAMKKVRDELGLKNVWAMLPFVRTRWEVEKCLAMMEEEGLIRDESFKILLMAEVPSIIFMADEFAKLCDGFSVGSNDLTQLILGIDRDSARLGKMGYFDERDEAVKRAIKHLIKVAHDAGATVSICGQAPSVYPELAQYLVDLGIDSLSVNPDAVAKTRKLVHEAEGKMRKRVSA